MLSSNFSSWCVVVGGAGGWGCAKSMGATYSMYSVGAISTTIFSMPRFWQCGGRMLGRILLAKVGASKILFCTCGWWAFSKAKVSPHAKICPGVTKTKVEGDFGKLFTIILKTFWHSIIRRICEQSSAKFANTLLLPFNAFPTRVPPSFDPGGGGT